MDKSPNESLPPATNGHSVDNQGSQSTVDDDRTNAASMATAPSDTLNGMAPSKKSNPDGQGRPQGTNVSFFAKLFRFIVPCITPSPAAHPIELSESPKPTTPQEKSPQKQPEEAQNAESSKPADSSVQNATPPPGEYTEVVVPPTPTSPHLLPPEETEGMTSGAVQPPGSKGDSPVHEKPHPIPISENEESEYTDDDLEDPEDDEEKLIYNGGAGIPIGPDGQPAPLLPPLLPKHAGRKCLVLDLDETLVHSSFKSISQADYVVPVEIEFHWHNVYVIKRPGVDNFLKKMGEIYEIVVFTASLSKYADPVLDKLDIHQVVSHRLFRESCYNHKGNYVKDLSQLGRPIGDTIILDNSPASYIFHPNNAVPVSSWFNDPHDTELTDLVPFLADLSTVDDIRGVLDGAR